MSTLGMARAERRDLADLCAGLSPADWEAPSLCAGWRVRDVVAHVVSYEGLGARGFAGRLVRARLDPHRANREAVTRLAEPTPAQLLELLRAAEEPTGLLAGFGGRIVLAEIAYAPQWIGQRVTRVEEATGARVALLTRLGDGLLPHRDSVLQEGDLLHVTVQGERLDEIASVLAAAPEES